MLASISPIRGIRCKLLQGTDTFQKLPLSTRIAMGSTWHWQAMVGNIPLHPGTKVAGPFVTRRFSWKFYQSSPTYGRLSHYDSSHEACAVFENWEHWRSLNWFIMLVHQYLVCTGRALAPIVHTTHGESAWSSYHSKCLCNRYTTTLPISPCVSLCFCATSSYERRLSFQGKHTIRSIQTLGMSPQKIPWGCCRSFVGKALWRERERARALHLISSCFCWSIFSSQRNHPLVVKGQPKLGWVFVSFSRELLPLWLCITTLCC